MTLVGGSVAISGVLTDAPMFTAQALRYAVAWLLLLGWLRMTRRPLHRPRGNEWWWLIGVAVSGLVLFNVALVYGSRHAEPAVLAVAVACVPIALALARPNIRILVAATVVTIGAVAVQGVGRSDALGLLWALLVFGCEVGFTLLALPVLSRHGPAGVSVHATWMAAAMFAIIGVLTEGHSAAAGFDVGDMFTIAYLAVGVTAVAFVFWYWCVEVLGAGRAGLLTGVAPVAAGGSGIALGGEVPAMGVWMGVALIAVGLALGLSGAPSRRTYHRAVVSDSCRDNSSVSDRT